MPYPCTVCGKDVGSADKLTPTKIPFFIVNEKTGVLEQVEGWTLQIASCASCLVKFGKPIKAICPPPLGDLIAEFEKAKRVILKGSPFYKG